MDNRAGVPVSLVSLDGSMWQTVLPGQQTWELHSGRYWLCKTGTNEAVQVQISSARKARCAVGLTSAGAVAGVVEDEIDQAAYFLKGFTFGLTSGIFLLVAVVARRVFRVGFGTYGGGD